MQIHGHAIVTEDDCIAGPDGMTPPALRNDADWAYFQQALDAAAFTALGRVAHEINPNPKRRRRVVLSRKAAGLSETADAWWWNPAEIPFEQVCERLAPSGGVAAVPGGRDVFDWFLDFGFDEFHLVRADGVRSPGGRTMFSACQSGVRPEGLLRASGLSSAPPQWLDRGAGVHLTVWRRR